jgi:hypothetical protein
MGGGARGPSKAEIDLQNQQLQLERERLELQKNASTAADQERGFLQEQMQLQSQAQQEQTSLLRQQSDAAARQQSEFSSILKQQQQEEERNLRLSKVEAVRASTSEAQQMQRANFGLLRNLSRGDGYASRTSRGMLSVQ